MGSWILILSLMTANSGTEIHSIKGFETKEKCESAGEAWKKPINDLRNAYSFYSCSYVDK